MSQFPGKLWQTWSTCFWLHVCRNPWLYSLLYRFAVLLSSFCSNLLLAGELVQECAGIYLVDISLISKSLKATDFNMEKGPTPGLSYTVTHVLSQRSWWGPHERTDNSLIPRANIKLEPVGGWLSLANRRKQLAWLCLEATSAPSQEIVWLITQLNCHISYILRRD